MNTMEKRLKELERMARDAKMSGLEMFMDTLDGDACVGIAYGQDARAYTVGYYCRDAGGRMYRAAERGPYRAADRAAWNAYRLYLTPKSEVTAEVA